MVEIQYWILLNPSINSWNDLSLNFMFYYHSIKVVCTRNVKIYFYFWNALPRIRAIMEDETPIYWLFIEQNMSNRAIGIIIFTSGIYKEILIAKRKRIKISGL